MLMSVVKLLKPLLVMGLMADTGCYVPNIRSSVSFTSSFGALGFFERPINASIESSDSESVDAGYAKPVQFSV